MVRLVRLGYSSKYVLYFKVQLKVQLCRKMYFKKRTSKTYLKLDSSIQCQKEILAYRWFVWLYLEVWINTRTLSWFSSRSVVWIQTDPEIWIFKLLKKICWCCALFWKNQRSTVFSLDKHGWLVRKEMELRPNNSE